MIESGDNKNFEMKWMDKLVDIDKDLDGEYDDDQNRLSRYSRFPLSNNNYLNYI